MMDTARGGYGFSLIPSSGSASLEVRECLKTTNTARLLTIALKSHVFKFEQISYFVRATKSSCFQRRSIFGLNRRSRG